jgi:hypothetical protein
MVQLDYKEARAQLVILDYKEHREQLVSKEKLVILEARAQLVLKV